jgi:hypothetical protein
VTSQIFINYRRDDDPSAAARVRDALEAAFGSSSIFMDVDNLLAGQRFDEQLGKALANCEVLVAVLGPRWMDLLKARVESGQRDYVREEIAAALVRKIIIIPVRVGRDGQMLSLPEPNELPPDIRDLLLYQKHDVAHERFRREAEELVKAIKAVRKAKKPRRIPWQWTLAPVIGIAAIAWVWTAGYFPGAPGPWPKTITFENATPPQAEHKVEDKRVALPQSRPATVAALPPTLPAGVTRRFALVIGNGAYRKVAALKTPAKDAQAIADKLISLGFLTQNWRDLERINMNRAIGQFLGRLGPDTDAVVYYSGHAVEVGGSNYLLPVDIPMLDANAERLLRSEAINLTDLLSDIEERHSHAAVVIVDASRDNPFQYGVGTTKGLGADRGLGGVEAPRGVFVIFSAGPGEEGLDNLGVNDRNPNSLFVRTLLPLLSMDGVELRALAQRLRGEVRDAALAFDHHSQLPSYSDQLVADFYFKPKAAD